MTERGRRSTEIFSVFGQIEAVAAEILIERGVATKIHARDIPPTALTNERGDPALFAVVVPPSQLTEFERLIRELRA